MAEEKRKISELPSNDSPSTSTVLVGVDGSDTVKIPITEFVLSESTNDITISTGRDINISANDAVEISANRTLGITAVDHITVESSNTMALNSDGANISFLPDGDMELFADGNIDLYSDNYVSLTSNGDMSIASEGAMSVITPGLLGLWGDQTGLYGNSIEFLAGQNDESYLYADGSCMQIMSPQTTISNVNKLSTKTNGNGQPGQVLTTNGSTVYWGNPSGGGSGGSTPMTYITYDELKALRDDASLEDGMFYRITDYQCTTSQEGTRATDHSFDIIVQALSCNTLSEIARAGYGGDDYFRDNNANLAAWEIKYCLDNDTTRFAWAQKWYQEITNITTQSSEEVGRYLTRQPQFDGSWDGTTYENYYYAWGVGIEHSPEQDCVFSENEVLSNGDRVMSNALGNYYIQPAEIIEHEEGKGVIYYMRDEHGNECPYDFKNIQFMRCISLENGYPTLDEENGEETWVYTFCGNSYHVSNDEWSELKDGSLESPYGHESDEGGYTFQNNIIKPYIMNYDSNDEDYTKCGKQYLNDNVFLGEWTEVGSEYEEDERPYHYPYCCAYNTLGYNCHSNTFGIGNYHNTLGDNSQYNTLKDWCVRNTMGINFWYNTLEASSCNTFGSDCNFNTFYYSSYNILGAGSGDNSFTDSSYNRMSAQFYFNTLETSHNNYFAMSVHDTTVCGSNNFFACKIENEGLYNNDSFVTEI